MISRSRAVYKTYRKYAIRTEVLRGLDLEVHPGEFLKGRRLPGPARARCCTCSASSTGPGQGDHVFDGRRIDDLPSKGRDQPRNQTFGFIFQFYHLSNT